MKNITFTTGVAISMALCTYGQQPPTTGNSNLEKTPTTGNSNINNQNAWSRAGNSQLDGGNIFGTRWNWDYLTKPMIGYQLEIIFPITVK